MSNPNVTSIPHSSTPIINPDNDQVTRAWYLFFQNLFTLSGSGGNTVTLDDIQQSFTQSFINQEYEQGKLIDGILQSPIPSLGTASFVNIDKGTWAPTITGSTTNPTVGYTVQTGEYINIGGLVQCNGHVQWTSYSGGSGNVRISLPFIVSNSIPVSGSLSAISGLTFPVGSATVAFEGINATSTSRIMSIINGGTSGELTIGGLGAAGLIRFSLVYKT